MRANRVNPTLQTASASISPQLPQIQLWVRAFAVVGGLLMTIGGLIALVNPSMLMAPHDEITNGVRIYAGYLVARNLALGLFLPLLLLLRAWRALSSLMILIGVIQFFDAIMDCMEGRWAIVPGVLLLGILFFIGADRVAGAPFWRGEFWR